MYNKATQILQHYWGFTSFKPVQEKIIKTVLAKENTLVLLPTGGGKSICFQVPSLIFEGVCIVISPLIALMQDQVANLTARGIKAISLPSGSKQEELITLFDNIRFGNYKFLYISPERLQSKFIQKKIKQLNVSLIAIDEAHCISEWGHDFRPSYRNIIILKELQPKSPIIALTATATKKVVTDIVTSLKITDAKIFKNSFYRENLAYQVHFTEDKLYKLKQIFTKTKAPAIVYVNSRNSTKKISSYLTANGFKSSFYHGGMTSIEKQLSFDKWMLEETPIMVATNAFGMGIDKPNVKVVVHVNPPFSVENYVQEAGRAGRNGQKAFSIILTNNSDIEVTKELHHKNTPSINDIKDIHQKLYQYFQIAKGEFITTNFEFNFLDFCNQYNFSPTKSYTSLQILASNGVIELENNYNQKSTVQFLVKRYQVNDNAFSKMLLRLYGGIFEQPTKIDEFYIAKKLNRTSWYVISEFEKLAKKEIISYNKATSNNKLTFLLPREDDTTINRIGKNIKSYLVQKKEKTLQLLSFIEENTTCRSVQLHHYFNEESTTNCGLCDVCLQNKKTILVSTDIIQLLKTHTALSSKEICEHFSEKETHILILLQQLLAEEKITINPFNKYTLL